MNKLIQISSLLFSILFFSCAVNQGKDGKKETDATDSKNNSERISDQQMEEKGFSKGIIAVGKDKECSYILTVEKYVDKLDPINIQDFFKSTIPAKVWVKYSSLRMNNRCPEARPVSITEITKRQ